MDRSVIVEAVRSPIAKRNGALSGVHPVELSAQVLNRYGRRPDQGTGAEAVAKRWNLDHATLDEFFVVSHQKAAAAHDSGAFDAEVTPIMELT